MYRFSVTAEDKTVLYNTIRFENINSNLGVKKSCVVHWTSFNWDGLEKSFYISGSWAENCVLDQARSNPVFSHKRVSVVCELTEKPNLKEQKKSASIQLQNISFPPFKKQFAQCRHGHVTHVYLACGPHSVCGQGHPTSCVYSNAAQQDSINEHATPVVLFSCDDRNTDLSYSSLCDFRHDCQDGSDESFCNHLSCNEFTCINGQCLPYSKKCDRISDCLDDSDERGCVGNIFYRKKHYTVPIPVLINFDGISQFIVTRMKPGEPCPDTHYRCPGDVNNCLPVYTRCNGVYDCIGHEDEEDCEKIVCPGFFRCQSSHVCVHDNHLCDSWPHCPQHDDELFCGMVCPEVCLCHGHSFLCPQSFSAHLFPDLRYLDATGSGLSPSDVSNNTYLVHLSLVQCALISLSDITLPNLMLLDLSKNKLKYVDMSVFVGSENLRTLSLAKNPLRLLYSDSTSAIQQKALRTLDLSYTTLTVFDSQIFADFLSLKSLSLSFTTIHTIGPGGFKFMPKLARLFMEGTPVKTFPGDVFQNLQRLHTISTDNYKLCCSAILPGQFEDGICSAPEDEISSCEDLLRAGTYRVFLWLISCMSVIGNMFCFIARLSALKSSLRGFNVFVTNLTMADCLMGVYIAVIGVADEIYQGRYLYYDIMWKSSNTCKIAGFLSLLSSEVSALIIWLITLDRFIVFRFPFSSLRFKRSSATMVCLLSWMVGLCLASFPLLPVTSHWEFYSQTGMCIPLPVTRQDFKGRVYSYSVMIVFNFVLFLLISAGQAFIYWSIQKNTLTSSTTKTSKDMTIAQRLITVAVTDFMCWFPIGMCGILALAGIPIPGEVNVALAVFVLPLNSALNPFLYTFNTLMEKRKKLNEAKLWKWLESHTAVMEN